MRRNILVLFHAESEESEKNHVRFGDGVRTRAHNGRPAVCSYGHDKVEIAPQVAWRGFTLGPDATILAGFG